MENEEQIQEKMLEQLEHLDETAITLIEVLQSIIEDIQVIRKIFEPRHNSSGSVRAATQKKKKKKKKGNWESQ